MIIITLDVQTSVLYAVLNRQRGKRGHFRDSFRRKLHSDCLGCLVNGCLDVLCISEFFIWIPVKWISNGPQCFSAHCCPTQNKMMKGTGHQLLNRIIFMQNWVWCNNWTIGFWLYNNSLLSPQIFQHFSGKDILCCQDLELIGNLNCVAGEQLVIL